MSALPGRVLCIRLSAVGDVVNTLPALEALRSGLPKAHIGFVVEDRAHDLLRRHPSVDRVHLYRRKRWSRWLRQPIHWGALFEEFGSFLGEIRREKYEVALNFQSNLKGALHAVLSGAPRRLGFGKGHAKESSWLFANQLVVPPGDGKLNRVEKFLSMAAALGVPVEGAGYRLPETPDSRSRVRSFLDGRTLADYVAIHPGTSDFGKLKRWPSERFAALARRIGAELSLPCLITWGPGERPLAEEIAAGSGGHATPAMETTSILDLAELIRSARLFVGCDSGPLHLASAVGAPSVALFGPKDPATYGPYNPRHRVVRKGEAGAGLMGDIEVDDVFAAARELLGELRGNAPPGVALS